MELKNMILRSGITKKEINGKLKQTIYSQSENPHFIHLQFNRPQQYNAMDLEMNLEFQRFLKEHRDKNHPKVILFSGAGDKAFTSGGDVKQLYNIKTCHEYYSWFRKFHYNQIMNFRLQNPVKICVWNGVASGGSFGYSMNCDIRIATEDSKLSMPESLLGYLCNGGASWYFPQKTRHQELGMYLGLTGKQIRGLEIYQYGLATHYIQKKNIEELIAKLINLSEKDTKRATVEDLIDQYSENYSIDKENIANLKEIQDIFNYDTIHQSFRRLNQSNTQFARELKEYFEKSNPSPFAQVLNFKMIKQGQISSSFEEQLFKEYRIEQGYWEKQEFREGVRAKIIDKDMNPKWKHKNVAEVSNEEVEELMNYNYDNDIMREDKIEYKISEGNQ